MDEVKDTKIEEKTLNNLSVTPVTKRLSLGCLTVIAVAVIGAVCLEKVQIKDALLVIIPIITSISALVDGGR